MKTYYKINVVLLLAAIVLISMLSARVTAQDSQFLLIDKTFVWDENTGGDGCYGYHFWTGFGEAASTNWKVPYDFENGQFYIRYQIIDQPQLPGGGYQSFGLNFCIWADRYFEDSKWKETCSSVKWFYGPGSVVEFNESPINWWDHPNGGIDWTQLEKLWRFGNPMFIDGSCQLASLNCTCADPSIWANERGKYLPLNIRITIVAVAQGYTFNGWDYYLNGGGTVLRQPTPNLGIDYANEQTNSNVPSTIEYASNSAMTGAVSGTGTPLALTPGQDRYFREKANGEILASYVQHLTVPARPAAPSFAWDQANQRTSNTVSSDYEYSNSADMSGAVSGAGTYVSIPAGTTKYFRKKATGSAFKSNVQTLQGVVVTSIGPEFVILNAVIDYPNTTDDNGFYFFPYNTNMPSNWLTPYDYYNGQIYTRYEIISQATSTPVGLQFGIWQKLPPETGTLYESMAEVRTLNGPGSVYTGNSSPNTYWLYNGGVDYAQMDKVWHFGINPWKLTTPSNLQIRQENAAVWAERYTYWFPMRVRVTVVAVASGYTFSGWSNYLNLKPATPTYGIDYTGEQTDKIVPSTDEYSVNADMSGAVSGTGSKISITPGQDLYFRTKAVNPNPASDIQHLVIPARQAAPSFSVDFALENTSTAVSAEYEYATQANMSGAITGAGVRVNVTPGTNLYIRRKATASAFGSAVQTLAVPSRPVATVFTVDYIAETVAENVSAEFEYSSASNMAGAITGSDNKPTLVPGTNLFIRKKATASQFASAVQELVVTARAAAPSYSISFENVATNQTAGPSVEYSSAADMSSAATGTGGTIPLTPGNNLYIRTKASISAFAGQVQQLIVPERPDLDATVTDTLTGSYFLISVTLPEEEPGFGLEDLEVVNCTLSEVSTLVYRAEPVQTGIMKIRVPANILAAGNFPSLELSIYYKGPTSGVDSNTLSDNLLICPSPVRDILIIAINDGNLPVQVKICDLNGKIVHVDELLSNTKTVDLSKLPSGIYLVNCSTRDQQQVSIKIVKD